jgi:hypothetical protein
MHKLETRGRLAWLTALTLSYAVAAPLPIGAANAYGIILVDGSPINGNATIFSGTVVKTSRATTDLLLQSGAEIRLATDSRGRFFSDHVVLEKGSLQVKSGGNFRIEADKLTFVPIGPSSKGALSSKGVLLMTGASRVALSVLTGRFDVTTSNGVLLAKALPGTTLDFDGQPGGSTAAMTITGTVTKQDGHYYLTVPETNVKYEIIGKDLGKMVGKKVTITGTPSPNGTATVIVASAVIVGAAAGAAAGAAGSTPLIVGGAAVAVGAVVGVAIVKAEAKAAPASLGN